METTALEPRTELERTLAAAQEGELSSTDFLETLAEAEVHMSINQSIAEEDTPDDVEPLVLQGPEDVPMLAIFTGADRASIMTGRFPDFGFTVSVPFTWVVSNVGEGMGVVLNPGWDIGATLAPEAIAHLRGATGES